MHGNRCCSRSVGQQVDVQSPAACAAAAAASVAALFPSMTRGALRGCKPSVVAEVVMRCARAPNGQHSRHGKKVRRGWEWAGMGFAKERRWGRQAGCVQIDQQLADLGRIHVCMRSERTGLHAVSLPTAECGNVTSLRKRSRLCMPQPPVLQSHSCDRSSELLTG
eukprot:jgi/Ulvmu1/2186/UM013_0032.1